jgi:hypothetical protein
VDDTVLLMRAGVSWLASVVTVCSAMLLRADSDGPPPRWPTVVAAIALLAVLFWPMTARRRRYPTFVAALVALQVSGHALLLFAATGHVTHSGASGLFCCPPTAYAGHGLMATLTANAGWLLLLVQLLVVIALSVPITLLHKAFLSLAYGLAAVVRAVVPLLATLLRALPPTLPESSRLRPPRQVGRAGRHVAGAVQRRGPPPAARVRSSFTLPLPLGACA